MMKSRIKNVEITNITDPTIWGSFGTPKFGINLPNWHHLGSMGEPWGSCWDPRASFWAPCGRHGVALGSNVGRQGGRRSGTGDSAGDVGEFLEKFFAFLAKRGAVGASGVLLSKLLS